MKYSLYAVTGLVWMLTAAGLDASDIPENPVDRLTWLQELGPLSPEDDRLPEIFTALEDRRAVTTEGGVRLTVSGAARKALARSMPDVESAILQVLQSTSLRSEMILIELLGEGRSEASERELRDRLRDEDSRVRRAALDALQRRFAEPSNVLDGWLEDGWVPESPEGVRWVGAVLDLDRLDLFLDPLVSEEVRMQVSARQILREWSKRAPEQILASHRTLEHPGTRAALAGLLAASEDPLVEEAVNEWLDLRSPPELLASVLEGVTAVDSDVRQPKIIQALFFSATPQVRLAAVRALGKSTNPKMALPLAFSLRSFSQAESEVVAGALQHLGEEAAEYLIRLLQHPSRTVRLIGVRSLYLMGESAASVMYRWMEGRDLDLETRAQLLWLIGRLDQTEGYGTETQQLFYKLASGQHEIEPRTVESMKSELIAWTRHSDPLVQTGSLKLLAHYDGEEILDAVLSALTDPDMAVAATAAEAISDRFFSLRSRIEAMMARQDLPALESMVQALTQAGYDAYRPGERARLLAAVKDWEGLNALPERARIQLLVALANAQTPHQKIALSWAVRHIEEVPDAIPAGSPVDRLPPLLPWSDPAESITYLASLDRNEDLIDGGLIAALALCHPDPSVRSAALSGLSVHNASVLDIALTACRSDIPHLEKVGEALLLGEEVMDLDRLAARLTTEPPRTARLLAQMLENQRWTPTLPTEAVAFFSHLERWPQLAWSGSEGLETLRELARQEEDGEQALRMWLTLAHAEGLDPLEVLTSAITKAPDLLMPALVRFFRDQGGDVSSELTQRLLTAGLAQSHVLAGLLVNLRVEPEDETVRMCMFYALGVMRPMTGSEVDPIRFLAVEFRETEEVRLVRACAWSLMQRRFIRQNASIQISLDNETVYREALKGTNAFEIMTAVLAAPYLHRQEAFPVLPALVEELATPRFVEWQGSRMPVRFAVADALIRIGPEAAEPLQQYWQQETTNTSDAAYRAMAGIADPALTAAQLFLIRTPSAIPPKLRAAAARSLGAQQDPAHVRELFELAETSTFEVRRAALDAVAGYGESAMLVLLEVLQTDRGRLSARLAAGVIARIGGPEATAVFREVLRENRLRLRTAAVDYLLAVRDPATPGMLVDLITDPETPRSPFAVNALVDWGREAVPEIIRALPEAPPEKVDLLESALRRMTGIRGIQGADAWMSWYEGRS